MSTRVLPGGALNLPFTGVELTTSINLLPSLWGALGQEGMFPIDPVAFNFVEIYIENDVIMALPLGDSKARQGGGKSITLKIPNISHTDTLKPNDIRNMLMVAARSRKPETLSNLTNRRLGRFKTKFELTWEIMRLGALKGIIVDGAGKEIYNLFQALEVDKKMVYFDLDSGTSDIQGKCDLLVTLISQDIGGEVMTGIEAWVSRSFFNKLIAHPKVEKFWAQSEGFKAFANLPRGKQENWQPREFLFGNVLFRENPAVVPGWEGPMKLVAPGKGHAYPAGTMDSHYTYVAPPEDIDAMDGGEADAEDVIHITRHDLPHGGGIELKGQMNALPLWNRPNLLVELDAGDGASTQAADEL